MSTVKSFTLNLYYIIFSKVALSVCLFGFYGWMVKTILIDFSMGIPRGLGINIGCLNQSLRRQLKNVWSDGG